MKFEVTIDNFNGPLDLMLYLIKDNKLDLFELNIDELADQYISFINRQESNKLEIKICVILYIMAKGETACLLSIKN